MNTHRWIRWPAGTADRAPIAYGADYNPEQWPRETWAEDVELMRRAHVNVVNLGIFSWAQVEPEPGEYRWEWMDEVMDLLHANGIAVDLGTGTSSPPPWLSAMHPEILPVTADGRTLFPGGRQHWRPTSPVFRRHALDHVRAVAKRYGEHPALGLWHVSNELGCHNVHDYSDDAAAAFRRWLRQRYAGLDELNESWATAFWSQRYSAWEQILPPRQAASFRNPGHQLDFWRFSSDALRDYLKDEVAVLREQTPDVPITTNFMVMGTAKGMDYAKWREDVDLLANDHYLRAADPNAFEELAFSAACMRGLARSQPWFLMEHSTSAVNWQPVNPPKARGQLARDSLTHLAFGADAISFFQWRQSAGGAEKFHSAMVPHAGTETAVWRDTCALGAALTELAEVVGSESVPARVALLFDWESWWASELDSHPSQDFAYRRLAVEWFIAFLDRGVAVDVQPVADDFSQYDVVLAPGLYLVSDDTRRRITEHVERGGHFVTTFFSGIVDPTDRVLLGGYPGAFRDLLGIRVDEFGPLLPGHSVPVAGGATATSWADRITVTDPDVEVVLPYGAPRDGEAAVTLRRIGPGSATYVGAGLDAAGLRAVVDRLCRAAHLEPELDQGAAGTVLRRERRGEAATWTFLINRTCEPQSVKGVRGVDVLAGRDVDGVELPPFGVAVLRR